MSQLIGYVISTQLKNTVKVRVPKQILLEKYGVMRTKHENYQAHDGTNGCLVGDVVRLVRCPRMSAQKGFTVAEIVKPAQRYIDDRTGFVYTNGILRIPVGIREDGKIRNHFSREEQAKMGLI